MSKFLKIRFQNQKQYSQFQVCPHAGGVGLCEMVQHLQMFDYVALSGTTGKKFFNFPLSIHSSLVDYLAQVIYTKNCPTTFDFSNWYRFLRPPRKISTCVSLADILRVSHRSPYQLENAIKSGRTVFCIYNLG